MGPYSTGCFGAVSQLIAADLGFYNGGCPIHLKWAPEVERRRRREEWGSEVESGEGLCPVSGKFLYFLYQNGEFYAFPVIFIDTNCKLLRQKTLKGTLIKKGGCPDTWTPPGSAPD